MKKADCLSGLLGADKKHSVSVDEIGFRPDMEREFARSKKGKRAFSVKPTGKSKKTDTVGAAEFGKMINSMKSAGNFSGEIFSAYAENFLAEYSDRRKTVVLDNFSPHRNKKSIEPADSTGAKAVFLPPYSPELNPIDCCWPAAENNMKKMKPRTEKSLVESYEESLKVLKSESIKSFFRQCWV